MENALALGTFDGLHKGHLSVLDIPAGYNKIALIFKIPPKCVKMGTCELLLTPKEKEQRLTDMGFDVVSLEFSEVEKMTAREFLEYIKENFSPKLLSCGFNYRFGFGGVGEVSLLEEFCKENGITLKISNPVSKDGEIISSSRIRNHLRNGEISQANRLLGRDFSFEANVIHGDARGRTLGFPTINQPYPQELVPLKFGVYETEVEIENKLYKAITNIGNRPTFPVDFIISETFVKDFEGDLYDKSLKISFKKFLRNEKKFSNAEDLKIQILKDIGE